MICQTIHLILGKSRYQQRLVRPCILVQIAIWLSAPFVFSAFFLWTPFQIVDVTEGTKIHFCSFSCLDPAGYIHGINYRISATREHIFFFQCRGPPSNLNFRVIQIGGYKNGI